MLPIDPKDVVRGQYAGLSRRRRASTSESDTETLIALKCQIDNWRWAGVPFFLRTGKRHGARASASSPSPSASRPRACFPIGSGVGAQGPDHLTFDLADAIQDVALLLRQAPRPRHAARQAERCNSPCTTPASPGDVLEAYERLILDAMRGDHTLFTTAEGIERLWEVSQPLIESPPPVRLYETGSWGPKSIHQLIAPNAWRLPFERAWRDPNSVGS